MDYFEKTKKKKKIEKEKEYTRKMLASKENQM